MVIVSFLRLFYIPFLYLLLTLVFHSFHTHIFGRAFFISQKKKLTRSKTINLRFLPNLWFRSVIFGFRIQNGDDDELDRSHQQDPTSLHRLGRSRRRGFISLGSSSVRRRRRWTSKLLTLLFPLNLFHVAQIQISFVECLSEFREIVCVGKCSWKRLSPSWIWYSSLSAFIFCSFLDFGLRSSFFNCE